MHIHILGICGTFMGGIAAIARQLGHRVSGSDANVYPPMSTQLEELGIELQQGYTSEHLDPEPDLVIIGNAMSRGNPAVEYVLDRNIPYQSGPQWLLENVLQHRWVLAASGTHGKTSTSSMLAWILESAGMNPGFLIGGVPQNFGVSARLGDSPFFVIEADEYDTAFFDKRSKFVHYRPRTLIINNLEFDHADIFDTLSDIQRQFHHVVRTVPAGGLILYPQHTASIDDVMEMGVWSPTATLGTDGDWQAKVLNADGSTFEVWVEGKCQGVVRWSLIGQHNVDNAMMAIAAARHAGVPTEVAIEALSSFVNSKRRLELKAEIGGITLYDDFAHHPTAIQTTLAGLRAKVGNKCIVAILEPRSNTMKQGVHRATLGPSMADADRVFYYEPEGLDWRFDEVVSSTPVDAEAYKDLQQLVERVLSEVNTDDHIVVMSNGGFGGIHQMLIDGLEAKVG